MTTGCPICGGAAIAFARHEAHAETWTAMSCSRCDSQFWDPRELRPEYYAEAHHGTYDRRRRGEAFLRDRHRFFLARATPGRLFDIGCGEGAFLGEARARGFTVAGLDLDPGNVETARSRGLDQVRCGLLDDFHDLGTHDWVTAFEVLEHQVDPVAFLRKAASLIAPGGRLCGSVPNRDRLLAHRKRELGEGDWPPHHFFWFSQASLQATLRAAGFGDVVVMPVPELDLWSQAASFEAAITRPLRRRRVNPERERTGIDGNESSWKRELLRKAKNAPFMPLSLLVRLALPHRGRQLYFEAAPAPPSARS